MEEKIVERVRRLFELSKSTNEAEAALAAEHMQRILTAHNMEVADLELKGQSKAPGIREKGHDLGKAAFKWKLQLAEIIAEHYFCVPLVDHRKKTVAFVGRPDNVDSLEMLYGWVIDQIKIIARKEREANFKATGEHIDPLRWQVHFGEGAIIRLETRFANLRGKQSEATSALVVHHASEVSDYLEDTYGYRVDGMPTKRDREYAERWRAKRKADELLKATDLEEYYRQNPWARPLTPEQEAEKAIKDAEYRLRQAQEQLKWEKKEEARRKREANRPAKVKSYKQMRMEEQCETAHYSGRRAADQINLKPFLQEGKQASGELV